MYEGIQKQKGNTKQRRKILPHSIKRKIPQPGLSNMKPSSQEAYLNMFLRYEYYISDKKISW